MSSRAFWSKYAPYLREFIAFKRSLGYKFDEQERILCVFDSFLSEQADTSIGLTKELTDKWSVKRNNEADLTRYTKILVIKQFSDYLRSHGVSSYIPSLPKYSGSSYIPHIYSYEEIRAIFIACDNLRLRQRNQSSSLFIMPCLLRMLYATGIRIGEALALSNKEVNITEKYLTLKETKNGKQRLVPFTESLALVIREYLEKRSELPIIGLKRNESPFFVSLNGTCCRHSSVYRWFRRILALVGIPYVGDRKGPRVHDLRHSFACHSFVKLSDEGINLYCSWPYLSTYLGHQSLESTEQYVRLTAQLYPELLKGSEDIYMDILPDLNDNQKGAL